MEKTIPTLNRGEMALWYPNANKQEVPAAAVVVNSTRGGVLSLCVFSPTGGQARFVDGVMHVYDYRLDLVEPSDRRRMGGWDFVVPAVRPDELESVDNRGVAHLPESKDVREEIFGRIIELHEEGKTAGQIAQALRISGYNKVRVEEIIEEHATNS